MRESDVLNYERAIELTEELYDYLKTRLSVEISKSYVVGYYSFMELSELNNLHIVVSLKGYQSTCISISSAMFETDRPFKLNLWKYNDEHTFNDIEWVSEKDISKFNLLEQEIRKFFNLTDTHYEQLTLF